MSFQFGAVTDMTEHELKCWPEFFVDLIVGDKSFELRKDDRNFQVGDTLLLREWNPETREYSGRKLTRRVIYKLAHREGGGCAADFGLRPGYAILGIDHRE